MRICYICRFNVVVFFPQYGSFTSLYHPHSCISHINLDLKGKAGPPMEFTHHSEGEPIMHIAWKNVDNTLDI